MPELPPQRRMRVRPESMTKINQNCHSIAYICERVCVSSCLLTLSCCIPLSLCVCVCVRAVAEIKTKCRAFDENVTRFAAAATAANADVAVAACGAHKC